FYVILLVDVLFFFFSSRRRHTRWPRDWSSDVCSSDLADQVLAPGGLDVEASRREDLIRRLSLYRLRAKVEIAADEGGVHAKWGRSEERRGGKEGRAGGGAEE